MSLSALRQRPRPLLLLIVALALLVAQGTRICIHAESAAGTDAAGAPMVHIESLQTADDDAGDRDFHLPQGLALVKFAPDITFVFLVAALWVISVVSRSLHLRPTYDVSPVTDDFRSLRPPLRAPPL